MSLITNLLSEVEIWTCGSVLCAIAGVAAIWLLTFYRARVGSVTAACRRSVPDSESRPDGVSVVVTAGDDAASLNSLLANLFEQEVECPMEVIVVNDGKNDDVKDCVTLFKHAERRTNLHMTFTPPEARNVSHRKLAITLGVKAARYPIVVLIDEHSVLPGNVWLKRMIRPFENPSIEVVLGSALPDWQADRKNGSKYRAFTFAADSVAWLSAALRGSAYRGHGFNLAYRTSLFFAANGFCSALSLRDGDDDIFINRVARADNVAVEISPATQIKYVRPSSRSEYHIRRPRRMFCAAMLRRSTPLFFGFSSLMLYTWLIASVGAGVAAIALMDWTLGGVAFGLVAVVWTVLAIAWHSALKALNTRTFSVTVPLMLLRRPWTNVRHKLLARLRRPEYFNI